ncbi:MAG: hypothetical protein SO314_02225, partial [Alphaproteobacteria bacterium]|nr:hypothetical protein [Alphaproteobacteria bacterium]
TCSDGSKRCSNYCVNDYFPNSCSNSSYCNGVYRNGYCSGSCNPPSYGGGSSSDWCDVHYSYHGNCCRNGMLSPYDPRCTGSGSSSSSSGSSGGSSGGWESSSGGDSGESSGGGSSEPNNSFTSYSGWCCDDIGSYCGSYSYCTSVTSNPDCSSWISQCENSGGTASFDHCSYSSLNQTNCSTRFNCT